MNIKGPRFQLIFHQENYMSIYNYIYLLSNSHLLMKINIRVIVQLSDALYWRTLTTYLLFPALISDRTNTSPATQECCHLVFSVCDLTNTLPATQECCHLLLSVCDLTNTSPATQECCHLVLSVCDRTNTWPATQKCCHLVLSVCDRTNTWPATRECSHLVLISDINAWNRE